MSKKLPERPVARFLAEVARCDLQTQTSGRRLIFALDATRSRQQAWDQALSWQQAMFADTADMGGIAVQLCYFQGMNRFVSSAWHTDSDELLAEMSRVRCKTGLTQIAKLLRHALTEAESGLKSLIYIGDAMEEDPEGLASLAGELGIRGVRLFMFQEGRDPLTRQTFQRLAAISRGAFRQFDAASQRQLRELLGAAAVFTAGGSAALAALSGSSSPAVQQLIRQLPD